MKQNYHRQTKKICIHAKQIKNITIKINGSKVQIFENINKTGSAKTDQRKIQILQQASNIKETEMIIKDISFQKYPSPRQFYT